VILEWLRSCNGLILGLLESDYLALDRETTGMRFVLGVRAREWLAVLAGSAARNLKPQSCSGESRWNRSAKIVVDNKLHGTQASGTAMKQ